MPFDRLAIRHAITGAGTDERVAGLVYIAAVVPDVQETVQSQLDKYPTEIFNQIEVDGSFRINRDKLFHLAAGKKRNRGQARSRGAHCNHWT